MRTLNDYLQKLPRHARLSVGPEIRRNFRGRASEWLDFDPVEKTTPRPAPTPKPAQE
jgi:hypothetical protein